MTRDPVERTLQELTRVSASAGFTARVVARAGERPSPRRRAPRWLAAAMAAAAIVLAVVVTQPIGTAPEPQLEAEVERLRHQHTLLVEDLERLDDLTVRSLPLVVVTAPDGDLLVLDLGEAALQPWPEDEEIGFEEVILARSTL